MEAFRKIVTLVLGYILAIRIFIKTEIEWSQWSTYQGIYKELTTNDARVTFSYEARLGKALTIRYSSFLFTMERYKIHQKHMMYSHSRNRLNKFTQFNFI